MSRSRRMYLPVFLFCLIVPHIKLFGQVKPVITNKPTVGSTKITGVGVPDGDIYICAGNVIAPAPLTKCNDAPQTLSGGQASSRVAKNGSFDVDLAAPLGQGAYVYATEVSAKAAPVWSERAVTVVIQPFIVDTLASGAVSVSGRGEPGSRVYVCQGASPPPAMLKDCSTGQQILPVAGEFPFVVPLTAKGGYFQANLQKGVSTGTSIYLAQVSDGYPAVLSAAVTVGASTAELSILTPLTAGTTEITGSRDPKGTVFVCTADKSPGASPQDCSKGTMAPLKGPHGSDLSSIPPDPGTFTFTANLTTALAGGTFVYLAQVIDGSPTTFSTPVSVTASAAKLSIQLPLIAGATAVSGTRDRNGKVYVCATATAPSGTPSDCSRDGSALILIAAPPPPDGKPETSKDGRDFTANLSTGLVAGNSVYLAQAISGNNTVTFSPVATVQSIAHEREHTDFVGGTLLSANGSNYSQGNIFLALNYDRALYRPGDYSEVRSRHPGLNFFFQGRLTTIPVNASQTVTTPTTTGSTATTTTPTVSSFLAAQKAAQFGGGGYLPIMFARSPHRPFETATFRNSTFYFAPVARFGFSTPSGSPSGSASTSSSAGTTTTTTTTLGTTSAASGQLYNYWFAGARIATADIESGSLHTRHYFDVGIGKYSNLQSLVCNPKKAPLTPVPDPSCLTQSTTAPTTTTNCTSVVRNGTSYYLCPPVNPAYESRTTLYRLAFEGYLEIPSTNSTSFILGISANTAMTAFNRRANLDINNKAPQDIDFLIAYKFDITKLLSSVKLIGQ